MRGTAGAAGVRCRHGWLRHRREHRVARLAFVAKFCAVVVRCRAIGADALGVAAWRTGLDASGGASPRSAEHGRIARPSRSAVHDRLFVAVTRWYRGL